MTTWDEDKIKMKVKQAIEKMQDFDYDLIKDENGEEDVKVIEGFKWEELSGKEHLQKRINRGELKKGTSLEEYNNIIEQLLGTSTADVSVHANSFDKFVVGERAYVDGKDWIVIFNADGIIKTAYPPKNYVEYFNTPYYRLGSIYSLIYK